MKKLLKGFTLVEILIVIVIIGILIGALVPRMSAAQGRARDVARKNDLANLQAAIIVAYQDLGRYPCSKTGCIGGNVATTAGSGYKSDGGVDISEMKHILEAAGMNTVPKDPLQTNDFYGVGTAKSNDGNYRYITMKSNGVTDGGFAVMAKTEIAGGSNWVVCVSGGNSIQTGMLYSGLDSKTLKLCENLSKGDSSTDCSNDYNGTCKYGTEEDLRYVMLY